METGGGDSPSSGVFTAFVDRGFTPPSPQRQGKPASAPAGLAELNDVIKAQDRKKLKQFLRENNWPAQHGIRSDLWQRVCWAVHKEARTASIYPDMVKEVFGEGGAEHDVTLPGFVDPTKVQHYHLSESGVHVAKKIVCIIGTTCPDVTYSPALFALTCAFLHYMGEEDCFNCLYGLVRGPGGYLAQTKKAHEVTKFVLKDLAKKYAKSWYRYVAKQGLSIEGVLDHWLWWILRGLPFPYLVRVLDCYLIEGPKVLYRVALAILQLFHKHIIKGNPSKIDSDIQRGISQFCEEMPVTIDKLMKVAFGLRGLSRREINRRRVKAEMFVESLRHTVLPQTIPKSESCESLNLKVSRSFSGPLEVPRMESDLLTVDERHTARGRSCSQGPQGIAFFSRHGSSKLLSLSDWQSVWQWLPTRITLKQPVLIYTTAEHGTSLTTFYSKLDGHEPTMILFRTTKAEVFGAYCSDDWASRRQGDKTAGFFGTGECFVFSVQPRRQRYPWVGLDGRDVPNSAHLFLSADSSRLVIGGGGKSSITIDENLYLGRSDTSDTFGNPPLVEGGDFKCTTVEVFSFE